MSYDPHYANVSLLLHGDGADTGTVFTDNSPSQKTVTAYGNAKTSTAQSKFGGSSIAFDGSGDYLSVPGSSGEFSFGTGDFTIEFWARWSSVAPESAICFGYGIGWTLYIYPAGKLQWGRTSPQSPDNLLGSASSVTTGQWYHIAVTRESGVVKFWIDGNASGSVSDTANYSATGTLNIGKSHAGAWFQGWIDDFRITKGVARYTGNFTPQTEPFPNPAPTIELIASASTPLGAASAYAKSVIVSQVQANTPLGSALAFAFSGQISFAAADTPLGSVSALSVVVSACRIAAGSPLGVPATLASYSIASIAARVSAASPLGIAQSRAWHDFTDEGLILATAPVLAPSPSVIAHGGGSVSIQSPLPLMRAGIEFSANSDLQFPSPLITVLAGGTVSATAPPPHLLSIARDSTGDYAASLTAPRPTLTAFGAATARATAPKPTLASGGTVVAMGSASVASPSVLVQSEGRVSAMVSADLRAPSASLIGYGGAVVSVTLSGKATVEASGTTGGIAGASLECPLFQLSAEATTQNYGSASLIAPSPEIGRTVQAWVAAPAARLTAIGTAVVTATFDTYVVNLLHRGGSTVDEVTHYTNFPFTHVVRYQNSYYGVNSTGLYLLEGTTDDGDPIEWAVQTAMEDFGSPRRKTVDSVYIEGRLGSATTVSLQSGEKTPNTYSHTTPRGATAQNHRQKLGRGVKERYHALGLAGDGEFELDAVEFNERETNRRI